jgi:hypothetical protein
MVEVNGLAGTAPITIEAEVGVPVKLEASLSHDPDGQHLSYKWFQYIEAIAADSNHAVVDLTGAGTSIATATTTAACRTEWLPRTKPCVGTGTAHLGLAVTGDGWPRLSAYRRIILNVHAKGSSSENR